MIRENNRVAWENALKELEVANSMFNYSETAIHTDIAIGLINSANSKINALKMLIEFESKAMNNERDKFLDAVQKNNNGWIDSMLKKGAFLDVQMQRWLNRMLRRIK